MPTYIYVAELDNTVPNQILIGATLADTVQNTVDAINAFPGTAGVAYSWPTAENAAFHADTPGSSPGSPGGENFTVRVKVPGTAGNGYGLSETSANFFWSGSHATGGTDGTTTPLTVGVLGSAAGSGLLYTRGSPNITTLDAPPSGKWLQVSYYRLGAAFVVIENSALVAARALIEHGPGLSQQLLSDTANSDYLSGVSEGQQALSEFSVLPESMVFATYEMGYKAGQFITLALTKPANLAALVNGQWQIQSVNATYIAGRRRFLFALTLISGASPTPLSFWEGLGQ